jgi:hypothetical protein
MKPMSICITRRELFRLGTALGVGSVALVQTGKAFARGARVPLTALLVDADSRDAQRLGRIAAADGMPVQSIRSDLTEVYCDRLAPRWREGRGVAVGGLTRAGPLFYLERLAWDAGMRVVFLGRHEISGDVPPSHSMRGPRAPIDAFHDSVRLIGWHAALARVLRTIPAATPAIRPLSSVRDAMVAGDSALFSWVIAPVPGSEVRS